jgi:spore coat polysaccharide biosynthesis protein SpsF
VSVLAIIQARLGSHRFPRKALADLGGKPLLTHVVNRVCRVRGVDDVVLAVPAGDVSRLACAVAEQYRVEPLFDYVGARIHGPDVPEDDVLLRFVAVAAMYPQHDTILRATGDCPLFNPCEAERVLALYRSTGCDYAWNVATGYVDGEDCEVFSRKALLEAHWHATDAADREHVTPWIRRNYSIATAMPLSDRRHLKTSVDTISDLERVRLLMECAA